MIFEVAIKIFLHLEVIFFLAVFLILFFIFIALLFLFDIRFIVFIAFKLFFVLYLVANVVLALSFTHATTVAIKVLIVVLLLLLVIFFVILATEALIDKVQEDPLGNIAELAKAREELSLSVQEETEKSLNSASELACLIKALDVRG